jgi:flagellar protein FlaJ
MRGNTIGTALLIPATAVLISAFLFFVGGRLDPSLKSLYFIIPVFLSLLMIPLGYRRTRKRNMIRNTESRLHDLLRDLSDYIMFGLPLSEAFRRIATNNYGPLKEEVLAVISRLDSGQPVENALEQFGTLSGSTNALRVGNLLKESSKAGSNSSDVVLLLSDFMSQMEIFRIQNDNERKNYDLILVISYAVFLIVILIIEVSFFNRIKISSGSSIFLSHPDVQTIKDSLNLGMYAEAFGMGCIMGTVRDKNPASGFMEGGFMILITAMLLAILGGF